MVDTDGMELRLAQYIQYKTNGKKSEFADKLGWSKQYLGNLLKGTTSIGLAPVATLLKTFPELNARWLLFGEGSMVTDIDTEIKRQLYGLLSLDKYVCVMSADEIKAVSGGQYEWSDQHYRKWEKLLSERTKHTDEHFRKSMEKQGN